MSKHFLRNCKTLGLKMAPFSTMARKNEPRCWPLMAGNFPKTCGNAVKENCGVPWRKGAFLPIRLSKFGPDRTREVLQDLYEKTKPPSEGPLRCPAKTLTSAPIRDFSRATVQGGPVQGGPDPA